MKYDLHIHTHNSRCSNLKPREILKIAKKNGLDGVAITDHDTIKGSLEALKENKDKDFEVIKGEEVTTDIAHVLALHIQKEIKPGNIFRVLDDIKKQDGLAIIAHPFGVGFLRKHLNLDINKIKDKIDALETFNARCFFHWENDKAVRIAKKIGIAQTAGSDAHFWFEIGKGLTVFEGDLRKAIKNKKTKIVQMFNPALVGRFLSGIEYTKLYK